MFKKLFLTFVLVLVMVIPAFSAPLENFGHNINAYTMYDARIYTDDSVTNQTGGWHLVVEMDDKPGAFEAIQKAKFVNLTTGLVLIAEPQTFERYVWLGRAVLGWDVWLGHELNAQGEWRVVLLNQLGERFTTKLFFTENEIHIPKPPFIQVLHTQPVDGGTLMTFKAPSPQNWDGPISVRLRVFGDADGDGRVNDCIAEYRNGCSQDVTQFCFDPSNDTTTFFVPYSGTLGRMEFRYNGTPVGINRTVTYFNLP
jgi:hypothetical protein